MPDGIAALRAVITQQKNILKRWVTFRRRWGVIFQRLLTGGADVCRAARWNPDRGTLSRGQDDHRVRALAGGRCWRICRPAWV